MGPCTVRPSAGPRRRRVALRPSCVSGCGTSLVAIHGSGGARLTRGLTVRGWPPTPKRTRRIWRDKRLQRPPQRKAKRHRLSDGTAARLRAHGPNDVWALDFCFRRDIGSSPHQAAQRGLRDECLTSKTSPTSSKPEPCSRTGESSTTPTGPTNPSAGSPPPPTLTTGRPTSTNQHTHSTWTHKRALRGNDASMFVKC